MLLARLGGAGHGNRLGVIGRAAGIAATTQQNKVVANYLSHVALLPLLVVPASRLEPPLDIDLFSLKEVVGEILRAPKHAIVPIGFFFPLAGLLILPAP